MCDAKKHTTINRLGAGRGTPHGVNFLACIRSALQTFVLSLWQQQEPNRALILRKAYRRHICTAALPQIMYAVML